MSSSAANGRPVRIGIIDTGVNPWHSHVRGWVKGMRLRVNAEGHILEDDDFSDTVGHGTAVAGILRQGLPAAELYAVRVFDADFSSYPSLVARGILSAAAAGCQLINLSLATGPEAGCDVLTRACCEVQAAGILLIAAAQPTMPHLLPAALPGVISVVAAAHLAPDEIEVAHHQTYSHRASGLPRELHMPSHRANFWGNSFACARVTLACARRWPSSLSADMGI